MGCVKTNRERLGAGAGQRPDHTGRYRHVVRSDPVIKMLGELALRANDLDASVAFYRDVVGLEVYSDQRPLLVFLKISEGVEGHPQIMGIFDRDTSVGQETTTLDHLAFSIDLADYDSEKSRLESLGVPLVTREFPVFGWRSLFFADPDGNTVELVAYDPSVKE
jgi:catechol 2,3-dioxygenase-like lactoylglutathione lyase family enzyme